MDFQSSKFGASGFMGGIAEKRLSGTNWKSPSNFRSARSTCVTTRQASRVASSPFLGMQSGMAKRWASPPMMISAGPPPGADGCCATPTRVNAIAAAVAATRRRRYDVGLKSAWIGYRSVP